MPWARAPGALVQGSHLRLEHLKIETSLIDEKFTSVMGECVFVKLEAHHLYLK